MLNKNSNRGIPNVRAIVFAVVAASHAVLILFLAVNVHSAPLHHEIYEPVRVMRLTDFDEIVPPPPPPPRPPPPPMVVPQDVPVVEAIAEVMIEVEVVPEQAVVAAGTLVHQASPWDDFLPAHRVTTPPTFDERAIASALVFPPLALRSGVEGRVMLELFVDRNGVVQHVRVRREYPEGWGFGEAAQRVFAGRRGSPAVVDGGPVAARFRYPISFRIR